MFFCPARSDDDEPQVLALMCSSTSKLQSEASVLRPSKLTAVPLFLKFIHNPFLTPLKDFRILLQV